MSFLSGLLGGSTGAGFQAVSPGQPALNNANQAVNTGINNQQAFVNAVNPSGLQGLATQQGLTSSLLNEAQGGGPNPAQTQLAQNTAANVANQAALQAGQRGGSQNVGLLARQIGQQGAATQQAAVGQAATLGAQQQLAAQGQLQNLAATQVGQNQGALTSATNAANANQGNLYGLQSNANSANAGIANTNAQGQQQIIGGLLGGAGAVAGLANGGEVGAAAGAQAGDTSDPSGPQSFAGKFLTGMGSQMGAQNPNAPIMGGLTSLGNGLSKLMASGGKVPVKLSPGEKVLSPQKAKEVAKGKADPMKATSVPGKAKVEGDSETNDTFNTKLPPGAVVVPRTKVKAGSNDAAAFVSKVMAKKTLKR